MSSLSLSPELAAKISRTVYAVREFSDIETALERRKDLGLRGTFAPAAGEISSVHRVTGKSGISRISTTSGFGVVASGVSQYQGDVLIALRGTRIPFDWLTDINTGKQSSTCGWPVHAGFNNAFKSLKPQIDDYIKKAGFISTVHCVGHSLGGALATLTAEYMASLGLHVKLYTLGCPRVGYQDFSGALADKVGQENIYRVYHDSDPVPMAPVYKFTHTPLLGSIYELNWSGLTFSTSAHLVENYSRAMSGQSWSGLRRFHIDTPGPSIHELVNGSQGFGLLRGSSLLLKKLQLALNNYAKEAQMHILPHMTVVDQLSMILHQKMKFGGMAKEKVVDTMNGIAFFLGQGAVTPGAMSLGFMRWMLEMFYRFIGNIGIQALNMLERN